MVKAVIRETPLLLKVENEGSDFMLTDLGHFPTLSSRNEEVSKVTDTVGNNGNGIGIGTLSLSGST